MIASNQFHRFGEIEECLPTIQNSELKDLCSILDLNEAEMDEWIWQGLNEKALSSF